MKIILDESVPQKLRLLIEGHSVVTVAFSRLVGAEERRIAEGSGRSWLRVAHHRRSEIGYQQNLTGRKMALLVLSTNNREQVKAAVAKITAAIDTATPGS